MATDRMCKVCKKNIDNLHRNCIRCEKCQLEHRAKLNRRSMIKRRKYRMTEVITRLGTTNFDSHRKEDFTEEATAVKKELKNLGLRK